MAAFSTVIVLNVITSFLIIFKIWMEKRKVQEVFRERTKHLKYYASVIQLVAETGAFYTITMILAVVFFAKDLNAELFIIMRIIPTITVR